MKEFLDAHPRVTDAADEATRRVGMEPWREPIRGGTDGAMLSARGLLTPNIFTGATSSTRCWSGHPCRTWPPLRRRSWSW